MATLSHSNAHFIPLDHRNYLANIGKTCDDARRIMRKIVKPENRMVATICKFQFYIFSTPRIFRNMSLIFFRHIIGF